MADTTALAALIIAQLQTITGLTVFDGKVGTVIKDDGITRPYAVLYMFPRNLRRLRYPDTSDQARTQFQVTCAAGTVVGCRWATDRVVDLLTDHRLATDSRATAPITMVSEISREVEDRSDLGDIRWYSTPLFSLTTTRS
jgi:hypothetical protein